MCIAMETIEDDDEEDDDEDDDDDDEDDDDDDEDDDEDEEEKCPDELHEWMGIRKNRVDNRENFFHSPPPSLEEAQVM